jgi:hypothetical protein
MFVALMAACESSSQLKTDLRSAPMQTAQTEIVSSASANAKSDSTKIDFKTSIQPILASRCQPCHFAGGKMYAKLPFDDPKTIRMLGTKLFSRIKDEKEQALIRKFLAMIADSTTGSVAHQQ